MSAKRPKGIGYGVAIVLAVGFLATAKAIKAAYSDLLANGATTKSCAMYSFADFDHLIGFEDVWAFERKYAEAT